MRVINLSMLNSGIRAALSQSEKGKIVDRTSRLNATATKPPRVRVLTGPAVKEEFKERVKYWRGNAGATQTDPTPATKKKHVQRKGFDIVREGQSVRERIGNAIAATFLNGVQVGRQDATEVRVLGTQESVGTMVRPSHYPLYLGSPLLKRRTEIKKDIELKMPPAPKEKRYFGIVKSTKGDQVLAEVSPAGDVDSWSAYFPKDSFKERMPKVGEEFEYTVMTFGHYSVARTKLLPERPKRDLKELSSDEQELLDWAANLHV